MSPTLPGACDCISFGNSLCRCNIRIFRRSPWMRVEPDSNDRDRERRGTSDGRAEKRPRSDSAEVEGHVCEPRTAGSPRRRPQGERPSPSPSEGRRCRHLAFRRLGPGAERIDCCGFQLPGLGSFVRAATGNSYRHLPRLLGVGCLRGQEQVSLRPSPEPGRGPEESPGAATPAPLRKDQGLWREPKGGGRGAGPAWQLLRFRLHLLSQHRGKQTTCEPNEKW